MKNLKIERKGRQIAHAQQCGFCHELKDKREMQLVYVPISFPGCEAQRTAWRICPECCNRFGTAIYGLFDIEINKLVETYSVKWKKNDK